MVFKPAFAKALWAMSKPPQFVLTFRDGDEESSAVMRLPLGVGVVQIVHEHVGRGLRRDGGATPAVARGRTSRADAAARRAAAIMPASMMVVVTVRTATDRPAAGLRRTGRDKRHTGNRHDAGAHQGAILPKSNHKGLLCCRKQRYKVRRVAMCFPVQSRDCQTWLGADVFFRKNVEVGDATSRDSQELCA